MPNQYKSKYKSNNTESNSLVRYCSSISGSRIHISDEVTGLVCGEEVRGVLSAAAMSVRPFLFSRTSVNLDLMLPHTLDLAT